MDALVLFFDGILALTVSAFSRSSVIRFVACWLIPIVVAFVATGPTALLNAHGESSMLWVYFGYLVIAGLLTSGVGALLGYFIRRKAKQKS